MSTTKDAKALKTLLTKLRAKYKEDPPESREAMDEFIFSFLLWEGSVQRAEAALKRIRARVVDYNELRVCEIDEIVALMGKTYPRATERAGRLKEALNEVYLDNHAVSLECCNQMSKRDARSYLESLEGMPHFVASRIMLLLYGAHALPVDSGLAQKLIAAGIAEEDADEAQISALLERAIKSGDGAEAYWWLQQWSDDPKAAIPRVSAPAKSTASKKTTSRTTKKTPRKKTTRSSAKK